MGDVVPFRRPEKPVKKDYISLHCLFCHTDHAAVVQVGQKYYDCIGCDETASVPIKDNK